MESMKFYGLLEIIKKKIDVSPYFKVGDKIIFSYDGENDCFEAMVFDAEYADDPVVSNVEQIVVDGNYGLEIPWWIYEAAWNLMGMDIKGFLVSPQCSKSKGRVASICLLPLDEIGKKPKKKEKVKRTVTVMPAVPKPARLSEEMLKSAFGEEFNTKAGTGIEYNSLRDYTDDF